MDDYNREMKINSYVERIESLPTIPVVVNQVLTELDNPNADLDEVAEIIMADQVLTLRIIRLINSAFWGLKHQVQSLKEAIVYMGFKEVRNVVLTTWLVNAFVSRVAKFRIETFWEHSFGCALVSRLIAKQVKYFNPEQAYLGGLLHDIGEVILCQYFAEEFSEVVAVAEREKIGLYDAEQKVMGITHSDFGGWLVQNWHLQRSLAEAVEAHHDPTMSKDEPELVAIINMADLFCRLRNMGLGFYEKLQIIFEKEPAWQILAARKPQLQEIDLERFTLDLDDRVDEVQAAVGSIYSSEAVSCTA
jgi:putative nucleotidyltransferase with HDIG domain